jgi:ubiquinol-cytochrome c reductase cytochrome b subunit
MVHTGPGTYTPFEPGGERVKQPSTAAGRSDRIERHLNEGAVVFLNKQCRNCHLIGGEGGMRASTGQYCRSDDRDQMSRLVLQGGGKMPAYWNALSPPVTKALVRF